MTNIIITILALAGITAGIVRVGLYTADTTGSALTLYPLIATGIIIVMTIIIVAITEIRYRRLRHQALFED